MDLKEYQELVDNKQKEVNQALRSLEDIDHRLGLIHSDTKVCLSTETEDNRIVTIKVSDIIPEDVLSDLFDKTVAEMKHARANIERRLDKALGIERKPAIENPVFEEAVKDMVEQNQHKTINTVHKSTPRVSKMQIDEVTDMIRSGKTLEDITKFYGYKSNQTVKNFVEKNSISVKPLKLDDGKIRACYTNGPFTMKQIAEEFHLDTKAMHEYCKEHGLLKPSKNDPFKGK